MSIEAVAIALHHSQASGTAKLVLLGIANHDGDAGSFPKTATLARYANVHPRRVSAAVAQLVALGEIKVHAQEGGTRSLRDELRPNVYEILLTCPSNCDRTSKHVLLDDHGKPLHFGRSYSGAYTGDRQKDQDAVERGRKSWATRQGVAVDKDVQEAVQEAAAPSDGNSTSDANSTSPSDGNVTRPSDGNDTTKNHPSNHQENPALVPSVTSADQAVENIQVPDDLRGLVPALPRAGRTRNDATKDIKDPLGLTPEQMSRNKAGAAMARAALRGQLAIKEAVEVKG
jgi:hypothetical protein